jgi:ABC-2 type transport system ATP-binding protein
MNAPAPLLEALDLLQRHPGMQRPALDRVSLTVQAGEVFGLLGPNGAGKTSAVSILSTLRRPLSGSLWIDGIDALRHPRRARRLIGCVPQAAALYGALSARENLRFFGRLWGLGGEQLTDRVEQSLAFVGLAAEGDRRVASLSGGMRHRASLAAGLMGRPRLLFLDEPTAGIDLESRRRILENIAALRREGTAILYTTHFLEEAEEFCSRVAILHRGRILAQGAPDRLDAGPGAAGGSLAEVYLQLTGQSPPRGGKA